MTTATPATDLTWLQALGFAVAAVVAFHLAYSFQFASFLIAVYLFCLLALTRLKTTRRAFYMGLTIGMLIASPQLFCFFVIFSWAAVVLWLVLAFWFAIFLLLARSCRAHFTALQTAAIIPFVWTGLEYFRSELYYLRFGWLNVGYAFAESLRWLGLKHVGMYGIGFLLMAAVSALSLFPAKSKTVAGSLLLLSLAILANAPGPRRPLGAHSLSSLPVAGVQLEFPSEAEVLLQLDKLLKKFPEAQLLVLSEYTFDGPVPDTVKAWCRDHERYLVVGGKDPIGNTAFFDTAFVIDPRGEIVFKQAKSVPIQFFKDGLPAQEQKLWNSPWGKIGICICYDLSYTRVTDRLVRLGAQALIVPTMDVSDWGKTEHLLHGRVAPVRAAEYGIPILRVASSGISQLVDAEGHVTATAPFPGQSAMLAGPLALAQPGKLPLDRVLALFSVVLTAGLIIKLTVASFRQKVSK